MQPAISVVMPTYNRQSLISNAIQSIINQTFKDWELIIIDDGSDDKQTGQIVRNFGDERIRYVWKEHEGLVAARNYGNQLAEADVIAVQDSDDLSFPDRFEKMFPYLRSYDVVYSGLYVNMWEESKNCISRLYVPADPPDQARLLKGQYIPGHPLYRRNIWEIRPFRMETQFAYDWMMYLDWMFSGCKFKAVNEGLYEYVRQEDSASVLFEQDGRRQQSFNDITRIMREEYGAEVQYNNARVE